MPSKPLKRPLPPWDGFSAWLDSLSLTAFMEFMAILDVELTRRQLEAGWTADDFAAVNAELFRRLVVKEGVH